MKKSLKMTLITGIILSLLSLSIISASAACPLTSIFFGNGNGSGNSILDWLFGRGYSNSCNTPAVTTYQPPQNYPQQNCPPAVTNCPPQYYCPPQTTTQTCPPQYYCPPVTTAPPQTTTPPVQSTPQCSTYADEVLKYVNEARRANGLSALTLDSALCAAAEVRAREVNTKFSHTRPNGTSCFTVLREYNIGYRVCGENIALGQRDAKTVVNAWMKSSGHRANILNPNYKYMGLGRSGNGWGQLFVG